MMNPLADINNICFVDTETRAEPDASVSDGNVKTAGTYRYARRSFVTISTWAIGDGPAFDISLNRGFDGDWLCFDELPHAVREFYKKAEQREAWFAAFNAGFDRQALSVGTFDFPVIEHDMMIDVMAQAVASNLAPSLEGASRGIGRGGKQSDGKKLINQFCRSNGDTPQSHPADWNRFRSYGVQDTEEMRYVWQATRALPFEEWEDYWISEDINERGVGVDVEFCRKAGIVADAEAARINRELVKWTNGQITAVTQTKRIADWVYDRLDNSEAREIMVKEWNEEATDGDADEIVGKLSLEKGRIEKLIAYFDAKREKEGGLTGADELVVDIITARQFGGSTSPFKFKKIEAQHVGGVLSGQYVFNGAQQTGRYSSKGVQVHNLTRATLGRYEDEAIEMINDLEV